MAVISLTISAVLAIILGFVVLIFPKFVRWALGLYLIVFGAIQLSSNYIQFSP